MAMVCPDLTNGSSRRLKNITSNCNNGSRTTNVLINDPGRCNNISSSSKQVTWSVRLALLSLRMPSQTESPMSTNNEHKRGCGQQYIIHVPVKRTECRETYNIYGRLRGRGREADGPRKGRTGSLPGAPTDAPAHHTTARLRPGGPGPP